MTTLAEITFTPYPSNLFSSCGFPDINFGNGKKGIIGIVEERRTVSINTSDFYINFSLGGFGCLCYKAMIFPDGS